MTLEQAIVAATLADATIAGRIGDRLRPLSLGMHDVKPFATYTITGRQSIGTISDGPADYRRATFEIGIFGDLYSDVAELSDLIRERLDDLSYTADGIEADFAFEDESDIEEAQPEGTETLIHLRTMTFSTLYRAT